MLLLQPRYGAFFRGKSSENPNHPWRLLCVEGHAYTAYCKAGTCGRKRDGTDGRWCDDIEVDEIHAIDISINEEPRPIIAAHSKQAIGRCAIPVRGGILVCTKPGNVLQVQYPQDDVD